jgi:hypothetical protein
MYVKLSWRPEVDKNWAIMVVQPQFDLPDDGFLLLTWSTGPMEWSTGNIIKQRHWQTIFTATAIVWDTNKTVFEVKIPFDKISFLEAHTFCCLYNTPEDDDPLVLLFPKLIWLSNLSILSVPDEGYSRNESWALHLISTF